MIKTKFSNGIIITIIMTTIFLIVLSCTENQRAKAFGGSMTLNLPKNTKLVQVTWKGESLWYLTRPLKTGEEVETYKFHEDSNYALMEGTVTIVESTDKK